MRIRSSDDGVAIVTVLLVIAVVGVFGVLSLGAAREDLRFSTSDTAAEQALDRAESGLDAAVEYLTLHTVKPTSTCVLPSTVNCFKLINPTTGTADIEIALSDKDDVATADDPELGEWVEFRVKSTASVRGTRRTLQQINRVNLLSLPYGLFIRGDLDLRGTPNLKNESILVEGNITGRDKVRFDNAPAGLGPEDQDQGWIYHASYISTRGGPRPPASCQPTEDFCAVPAKLKCPSSGIPGFYYAHLDMTLPVGCAGAFASGTISLTGGGAAAESKEIHTGPEVSGWKDPTVANCTPGDFFCHQDRDIHQRVIGLSGSSQPVVDVPDPLVIVRHLEELRRTAQDQGLYFNTTSSGGGTFTYDRTETKATTSAFHRHFGRDLVFFFETKPNQTIRMTVSVRPDPPSGPDIWEGKTCTTDFRQLAATEVTEVSSQSAIVIVRGGATLKFESICWSGAVFNQSGELELAGNSVFIGTIWTEKFTSSGTNTIKLDPSWFGRIPAGFRDVQRRDWVECESFVSPSC